MRSHVAVGLLALTAGLAACAQPLRLETVHERQVALVTVDDTVTVTDTATVQVRFYKSAPTVSVVGWTNGDAGFGLRSSVRRDGSLVHDHRFYVSSYYDPAIRSYHIVSVPPVQLERLGTSRDVFACYYGKCSPFVTLGWRLTDEMLRGARDSLVVQFHGRQGREMSIAVPGTLIAAYLTAVDSVTASLRKPAE
jgi:hypothetical protein